MIVSTVQLRKLVADDGMTLTDGDSYGKTIYLGVNDSPENWHEITDAEADAAQAAAEEAGGDENG